jgi:hypothetical protein
MAFRQLGDLKTKAVFMKEGNAGFDFATVTTIPAVEAEKTVQGVYQGKTSSGDQKTLTKGQTGKFFFIEDDLPDVEDYDSVTFNSTNWKIVPPVTKDGYLITLTVEEKL